MLLAGQSAPGKVRVGTFDSRAIALAYARSAMFAADRAPVMKDLEDRYEKAKAEKNEQVIKELEAWPPTHHKLQMLQVFSIASVADILEKVKDNVPKVAQEAGVDMIVSKWEVPYKNPSIETVDVTSHLAKLFNPDEQTLKIIEELSKQPPMPLLEALLSKEE
jgi:hypothetical protein